MAKSKRIMVDNQELVVEKSNGIRELFIRYMKARQMTFADIGAALNCSGQNVCHTFQKPIGKMTFDQVFDIANALGCPRSEVLKAIDRSEV